MSIKTLRHRLYILFMFRLSVFTYLTGYKKKKLTFLEFITYTSENTKSSICIQKILLLKHHCLMY